MGTLKDRLTNYLAIITIILTAVLTYLQSSPQSFDWNILLTGTVIAILSYVTGKDSNIQPKV